jgi:hypothetical protein
MDAERGRNVMGTDAAEAEKLRQALLMEKAAHLKTKETVSGLKSVNQRLRTMLHDCRARLEALQPAAPAAGAEAGPPPPP